jgi:hypothetical protein
MPQDGLTLDEIGAQAEAQVKPKLGDIKLDGDDVPETFKGKSVADIVAQHDALQKALKVSEESRQMALAAASAVTQSRSAAAAAPQPAAPAEEKELTAAEIKAIHDEDPIRAMMIVNEQNNRKLLRSFEARVAPLVSGTANAGEHAARTKYATEFQVLGKEIEAFVGTLSDQQKQALAQPGAWDQLVTYVRGQHVDKLVAHAMTQQKQPNLEDARKRQDEDAAPVIGIGGGSAKRGEQIKPNVQWDPTLDEIIKQLGISKEEYLKFYVEG